MAGRVIPIALQMTNEPVDELATQVEAFLNRHNLVGSPEIEAESKAIHWTSSANLLVNQGYARLTDHDFTKSPAVGFILQMLHRAFEHTNAAIVAFTTGSLASSEGISRMALESSVSILYILAGKPESRLLAYFAHYKEAEDKRLRNWEDDIQKLTESEKQEHLQAITLRKTGVEAIGRFLTKIKDELQQAGIPLVVEHWPNAFTRFDKLGIAPAYRTVYSRMSGQVHTDAEETIRYIIGSVSGNQRLMERMAVETIWFSRLMLYLGVNHFLKASATYCETYGMDEEFAFLKRGRLVIGEELEMLTKNAPDDV